MDHSVSCSAVGCVRCGGGGDGVHSLRQEVLSSTAAVQRSLILLPAHGSMRQWDAAVEVFKQAHGFMVDSCTCLFFPAFLIRLCASVCVSLPACLQLCPSSSKGCLITPGTGTCGTLCTRQQPKRSECHSTLLTPQCCMMNTECHHTLSFLGGPFRSFVKSLMALDGTWKSWQYCNCSPLAVIPSGGPVQLAPILDGCGSHSLLTRWCQSSQQFCRQHCW